MDFHLQAAFTEDGVSRDLHVGHEVTILAISLFVEGLGASYSRTIAYACSYSQRYWSTPRRTTIGIVWEKHCLSGILFLLLGVNMGCRFPPRYWCVSYNSFTFPVLTLGTIAVYLIFRFFTGFAGSAFLSVAGGSVSDLFSSDKVAK